MPEPIVTLNEESLRSDLRELVRKTVEDTLNGLLEAEADDLVGAERYERTAEREAYRAGHYDRGLTTSSGEVTIHMPKLKGARFTTAIIERYRRRETSVEEVVVDGVIDLFPNLIHKEIEGGHHIDIDSVSVRYIFVIIIHRLVGEVIGTVVEDAFRGHEEIHGEVLSVEKEGTGPTRSPL